MVKTWRPLNLKLHTYWVTALRCEPKFKPQVLSLPPLNYANQITSLFTVSRAIPVCCYALPLQQYLFHEYMSCLLEKIKYPDGRIYVPDNDYCCREAQSLRSYVTCYSSMDCSLLASCLWNSPDKNTRVGSHSLLQGIFPIQGLNVGLLHCRQILYSVGHHGSPDLLKVTSN